MKLLKTYIVLAILATVLWAASTLRSTGTQTIGGYDLGFHRVFIESSHDKSALRLRIVRTSSQQTPAYMRNLLKPMDPVARSNGAAAKIIAMAAEPSRTFSLPGVSIIPYLGI